MQSPELVALRIIIARLADCAVAGKPRAEGQRVGGRRESDLIQCAGGDCTKAQKQGKNELVHGKMPVRFVSMEGTKGRAARAGLRDNFSQFAVAAS